MVKKSFFKERTKNEIISLPIEKTVSTQRGLVERIFNLDPSREYIHLRSTIIPGEFYRGKNGRLSGKEANLKCYKHGERIALSHPNTMSECYSCPDIPLAIRKRDFNDKLSELREEEVNFVRYSFQPRWGDRIRREIPFVWCVDGLKLYDYAETQTSGIVVEAYPDARKVRKEGASAVVEVPSRTKGQGRYKFKLLHVPYIRGNDNLATLLTLKPATFFDEESREPAKGRPLHSDYSIKYNWENERESSEVITFYPQDLAAYMKICAESWKKHNKVPMEMNPFILLSEKGVYFNRVLNNNVLIYDPSLTTKDKLRKPNISERSILNFRGVKVIGHDEFAVWDPPNDGALSGYDWSTPGEN